MLTPGLAVGLDADEVAAAARALAGPFSDGVFAQGVSLALLTDGNATELQAWNDEGGALSRGVAYSMPVDTFVRLGSATVNTSVPDWAHYTQTAQAVIGIQLAKGGARLAAILNAVFDPPQPLPPAGPQQRQQQPNNGKGVAVFFAVFGWLYAAALAVAYFAASRPEQFQALKSWLAGVVAGTTPRAQGGAVSYQAL